MVGVLFVDARKTHSAMWSVSALAKKELSIPSSLARSMALISPLRIARAAATSNRLSQRFLFWVIKSAFVLKLVSEEVCSLCLGIFHAWSLKIMLMVGDHVFFIPRRIRLSICERDIALPTEVRIACAVVSF